MFEDLILGLWTGTGTHVGEKPLSTPAGPLPATNRRFRIEGVSWIAADGQLLRENLANEDTLRIIHDLGVKDVSSLYATASASLVLGCQYSNTADQLQACDANHMGAGITLNHPLLHQNAIGRAQVSSFFNSYWRAFSDVDINITHSKQATGINAFRWNFTAQHTGRFFGINPTGKQITHQGVTVCITNTKGEVEEVYINENLIVLLGQMESKN